MSVSAENLLQHARELLDVDRPSAQATAGLWPRASALLARQALEETLDELWRARAPGLERCPMRAQLLCVDRCLPETGELPKLVRYAWSGLSRACHQHPYELPPTLPELARWIGVVEQLRSAVTARAFHRGARGGP